MAAGAPEHKWAAAVTDIKSDPVFAVKEVGDWVRSRKVRLSIHYQQSTKLFVARARYQQHVVIEKGVDLPLVMGEVVDKLNTLRGMEPDKE